jgi:hypothetical protein
MTQPQLGYGQTPVTGPPQLGAYNQNAMPNTVGGANNNPFATGQTQSGQVEPQDSGGVLGSSSDPGFFGTGQYVAPSYNIQQGAFNNPNFTPGAYNQQAASYLGNTTAPVQAQGVGGQNAAWQNAGVGGQLGLAQQYANMAAGKGPSLANVQAQQQGQTNLSGAESMLGSARGAGSPAAAQLAAQGALASGQQQVAQNAVQGRTAEELGAMGAQGGLYGNVAQLGQGNLQYNAGAGNQVGLANQANTTQANTALLGSLGQQGIAQQQGQQAGQQLGVQQQLGIDQVQQQAYASAAANNQKASGSLFSGLSGFVSGL